MIKEEYSFCHMEDYLYNNIDLLISGQPNSEERSSFFSSLWMSKNKDVLFIDLENNETVIFKYLSNNNMVLNRRCDLCVGLPKLLKQIGVSDKNVLLDMSSLGNVLIMFLTKQLLTKVVPNSFFASYIRPEKYSSESGNIGYELCQQIGAVDAVPGFTKRESDNQTLCAFLGFEGVRLKGVLETVHSFERLVPIVAFPTGTPQWYNVTMWNSMDILQSEGKNLSVYKCYSESVFEAINLLDNIIAQDETVVLAPLGTRPHSMACAIFACHHEATKILYDFVIESNHRAIGVSDITIYHLSSFIKS
ncbi:MAG: hypothetical protein E7582_00730 [Ruminococcaceae bacterium]|nr:hypothetical protein [Oscillospiraceae bacterium]